MDDEAKAKAFMMMADAAPIAQELIKVLEAKGVPAQVWMVAMAIGMLSFQIDGQPVTPEFLNGIFKTIYAVQKSAAPEDAKTNPSTL